MSTSPGRAAHPRLTSPPDAEDRVRRTNEYRASRSRARAYRDGLRATAASPAPAPAQTTPTESPRSRARTFAASQGWLTGSVSADNVDDVDLDDVDDVDDDVAAAARARRRESEGLADELVYPGGLTAFEDSDEDARAAPSPAPPKNDQAALIGVVAALALALLAIAVKTVGDAAAAALEGVNELATDARATLAKPYVAAAIVTGGFVAALAARETCARVERRAIATDLLEAAITALEDARRLPGSRARVPCDHLRDALIRARWPLAGARRRAALKAWAIVVRELDSDARIRAVNVQVAGRRMKHFEYVALVRTASPRN